MIHSSLLESGAALPASGFTERTDGDLRPGAPGQPEAAAALVRALGGTGPLCVVSQVHGARVVDAADALAAMASGTPLEADGIVSTRADTVIAVRVADCVPVLLRAPGGVAALHAGWRGTAADIVRIGLHALCHATGCAPGDVRAAIGPCISAAVYEVGDEVVTGLRGVAVDDAWRSTGPRGRDHADLTRVNADILRHAGVAVEVMGACTVGDPRFWSHRRDGASGGRQAGAIRWTGAR